MKSLNSTLLVSILFISVGCKSQQNATTETTNNATSQTELTTSEESNAEQKLGEGITAPAAKLLASIRRTPCYGKCPTYQIEILDNGQVVYQGKRFVEKIGTYSGLLSGADIETLQQKIKEVDYFNLEDAYDVPIADFPTCITSVSFNGKSKTVADKQGAPQSLKNFERYLDSLLDGLELTKVSDEVSY